MSNLYDLQEKFLDDYNVLVQTFDYMAPPEGINRDDQLAEMLEKVDEHFQKFGHIFDKPREVDLIYDTPKAADGLGLYHGVAKSVTFMVPGTMQNLQNIIDDAREREFFVARNATEIITHEMSHAQHHLRRPDLWPDLDGGKEPKAAMQLTKKMEDLKGLIKDDISEYATTNLFEFVAEYSTMVIHQGKDGILADEVHDFFKEAS